MLRYLVLLFLLTFISCKKTDRSYTYDNIDFKQEMRNFVQNISQYAKNQQNGFIIIPQNGVELITTNGEPDAQIDLDYIHAIDGQAQESLFFGYEADDQQTPPQTTAYLKQFLDKAKSQNKQILISDYCYSPNKIRQSKNSIRYNGYIGFTAIHRELDVIPGLPVPNENNQNITSIEQAKNFLYLINPGNFSDKELFIMAVSATNYDVIITDLFFNNHLSFTSQDITRLKQKANGGERLVIAYVSIGEAEDYRYYWQNQWANDHPIWLDEENPDWPGNYKVRYWEPGWQKIIYGNDQSYLKKVMNTGFDGAYLDIIDAFEYYENKTNQ